MPAFLLGVMALLLLLWGACAFLGALVVHLLK
jgi:hypothetical protein